MSDRIYRGMSRAARFTAAIRAQDIPGQRAVMIQQMLDAFACDTIGVENGEAGQ